MKIEQAIANARKKEDQRPNFWRASEGAACLLPADARQSDGFEVLEVEIAATEAHLALLRARLAKLKSRGRKRRPAMAKIAKLEAV